MIHLTFSAFTIVKQSFISQNLSDLDNINNGET